jgi:hypothetical protein
MECSARIIAAQARVSNIRLPTTLSYMRARPLCQEALEERSTMWGNRHEMDRQPGLILCECSHNLGIEIA